MARLVVLNLGLHGHINPTLAMTRELIARGHSISYFAPEEFAVAIRETGAEFRPYRSVFSQPVEGYVDANGRTPMPIRLVHDGMQAVPQLIRQIEDLNPDAILFDVMCLPGRVIAAALGKPTVRLSSTFVVNEKMAWKPKAAADSSVLAFTKDAIAKLAADLGIAPFAFQEIFTEPAPLNIVFTTNHLQPEFESFDSRFVFVGTGIDDAREVEERREVPFVYVSLGTVLNNRPEFYRACIQGLREGPRKRALISVGGKAEILPLGPLPDGIHVVRHAPQIQALCQSDVFVSHGGMNSLMEALHFGVPLILFPQMEEQRVNAERLRDLGAGVILEDSGISRIGGVIDSFLSQDSYREKALELKGEVRRAGGFRRAANSIHEFARSIEI